MKLTDIIKELEKENASVVFQKSQLKEVFKYIEKEFLEGKVSVLSMESSVHVFKLKKIVVIDEEVERNKYITNFCMGLYKEYFTYPISELCDLNPTQEKLFARRSLFYLCFLAGMKQRQVVQYLAPHCPNVKLYHIADASSYITDILIYKHDNYQHQKIKAISEIVRTTFNL